MNDFATVLTPRRAERMSKAFLAQTDGTIRCVPYGLARLFKSRQESFDDLLGLLALIERLQRENCTIIRGVAAASLKPHVYHRRLVHDDPDTGDQHTYEDVPHHWFMLDLDGAPNSPGFDLGQDVSKEVLDYILSQLPNELRGGGVICQFSASQSIGKTRAEMGGVSPTLKVHLFFWNVTPLRCDELTRWGKGVTVEGVALDVSVFRPVQPHYILAPRFMGGLRDPVARRLLYRHGGEVKLIIPARAMPFAPPPRPKNSVSLCDLVRRAEAYAATWNGVSRGERSAAAYRHAAQLRDFGVSQGEIVQLLQQWNELNAEPLPVKKIQATARNVDRYAKYAFGWRATEPMDSTNTVPAAMVQENVVVPANAEHEIIAGLGCGKRKLLGIRTGFYRLDDVLSGLIGLIVLGGLPGGGKTSLCIELAWRTLTTGNAQVLYFSFEQTRQEILRKILAMLANISYRDLLLYGGLILGGKAQKDSRQCELELMARLSRLPEAWEKLKSHLEYLEVIDGTQSAVSQPLVADADFSAITRLINEKRERREVLVVFDHLHNMPLPGKLQGAEIKAQVDYSMTGLHAVKKNTDATMLVACQKNRQSYQDDKQSIGKLFGGMMGSAKIEQMAETLLEILPTQAGNSGIVDSLPVHHPGVELESSEEVVVWVHKQRYGRKSVGIPFRFDGKSGRYYEK